MVQLPALCIDTTDSVGVLFTVPPKIDRNSFSTNMQLKAGKKLDIDVKFRGEPPPVATWLKAGQVAKYNCMPRLQFGPTLFPL